ncbi:DUF3892 domain-containing protein [Nocardioides sp. WS12]|uniref:DUF3892 domain-containing protein n=1 Tax=Nocardioides sp. WS12 TaxID=2486272 RepID=UPI0015FABE88|nr:DUF3892 domain-containing protein [Nocardioides sp. WS12]
MAIEITHVRLSSGGSTHEHITDYKWRSDSDGSVGSSDKPTMVKWVDDGGVAYVGSAANKVNVGVVRPTQGQPYLRTHADGSWTNNLLSLPRF